MRSAAIPLWMVLMIWSQVLPYSDMFWVNSARASSVNRLQALSGSPWAMSS
jgi:hypothetical protein